MKTIGDFGEKEFLSEVLGTVALTAKREMFDDCVVIDLAEVVGVAGLPYIVYSLDHPSFVRHALGNVSAHRFYGRWLAAVTCNDVVAMGGRCRGFALDLSAPLSTGIDDIRELISGIREVLDDYGAVYEGGNFDASALETVGFAWGVVQRHALVRRQGARPGDLIVVTGILGQGWVEYLVRKNNLYGQIEDSVAAKLRHYKEMPVSAHRPIATAAEDGCFSSGMDLSDGLVEFLYTIADRNQCGVLIDSSCLPVSESTAACLTLIANTMNAPSILVDRPGVAALDAGYDSPLVHGFTVPPDRWSAAQKIFAAAGASLFRIGAVVEASGVRLQIANRSIEVPMFWDDQCRQGGPVPAWVEFLHRLQAQL